QTLGDLLKADREKPGSVNVGTINVGGTQNLTAHLFNATAGAHLVIVPFRTSPDIVVGLLRNDVQLDIDFYAALKPTLDGGKSRAIATAARGARRNCPTCRPCRSRASPASMSSPGTGFMRRPARRKM